MRYNIFGNVPWEELPIYVFNKALSLTVVFLILISVLKRKRLPINAKKLWKIIFVLTVIHVFISFRLLGTEYYPKFYFNSEMNLIGYLTISFGITAFIGLIILNSDNLLPTEDGKLIITNFVKKIVKTLIPILIGGHLLSMGIAGWIKPFNWFGYLAPISLIAFVVIIVFMLIKARQK